MVENGFHFFSALVQLLMSPWMMVEMSQMFTLVTFSLIKHFCRYSQSLNTENEVLSLKSCFLVVVHTQ